jgi:hypothetical protein
VYVALFFSFYPLHRAYAGENPDVTDAGDVMQFLLPALAGGSTLIAGAPDGSLWDREGTWQFAKSFGSTMATVQALKQVTGKRRPNSTNRDSFPSGHAAAAFSGASFIGTRYGWKWGIPAYAAAIFTAYSRVQADAHFADDVTAGASVALMYNWLFVTPQSDTVTLMPMISDKVVGLKVMFTESTGQKPDPSEKTSTESPRRFRFNFASGPALLEKNKIAAPSGAGTTFDLDNFDKSDDPTTTAAVDFAIFLGENERHELNFLWAPFESRDTGSFSSPVLFAGKIFPANTAVDSEWRLYDIRARYRYTLIPADPWDVKVGAGISFQILDVRLRTKDGTLAAKVEDLAVLPYVHGSISYNITNRLAAVVEAEGIYLPEDRLFDGRFFLNYRISNHWDVTVGYQLFAREIDTSDLDNKVAYNVPYFAIAYSW